MLWYYIYDIIIIMILFTSQRSARRVFTSESKSREWEEWERRRLIPPFMSKSIYESHPILLLCYYYFSIYCHVWLLYAIIIHIIMLPYDPLFAIILAFTYWPAMMTWYIYTYYTHILLLIYTFIITYLLAYMPLLCYILLRPSIIIDIDICCCYIRILRCYAYYYCCWEWPIRW